MLQILQAKSKFRNFIQVLFFSILYNEAVSTKYVTGMPRNTLAAPCHTSNFYKRKAKDMKNTLFEAFDNGTFKTPATTVSFADIPWSNHPVYEGVALKHLVTAKDTDGQFSYHLVHIASGKSIESHIHETQCEIHEVIAGSGSCICQGAVISYCMGTISVMPAGVAHEVNAGAEGLCLFAKFMPALC